MAASLNWFCAENVYESRCRIFSTEMNFTESVQRFPDSAVENVCNYASI